MGRPIHKVGMPPEHIDTNHNPVPRMNMPMLSDPEVSILMVMIMKNQNIGLDIIAIVLTSTAIFTVSRIAMTAAMNIYYHNSYTCFLLLFRFSSYCCYFYNQYSWYCYYHQHFYVYPYHFLLLPSFVHVFRRSWFLLSSHRSRCTVRTRTA